MSSRTVMTRDSSPVIFNVAICFCCIIVFFSFFVSCVLSGTHRHVSSWTKNYSPIRFVSCLYGFRNHGLPSASLLGIQRTVPRRHCPGAPFILTGASMDFSPIMRCVLHVYPASNGSKIYAGIPSRGVVLIGLSRSVCSLRVWGSAKTESYPNAFD